MRSVARATEPVEQFFHFSLLGLLTSGFLALAGSGSLDVPTILFTSSGLLLRLLLLTGLVRLSLDPRWTAAVTVLYIGFYPLDILYVSSEFIPATIHLICFLAVVRILTAETSRDYFFVKVIAFLELLAATLLSTGLNFFAFLILFITFGVATFCGSEIRRSSRLPKRRVVGMRRFHGRLAAITAGITFAVILMTGGLFFLLPRTARAAFRSMVSERYHLPGFSSEITLGQIGELKQQSTPVMHVRIQSPNERLGLKWRGSALGQFDGSRWYNPPAPPERVRILSGLTQLASDAQRRRAGPRISYEVRIGPIDSDALFFAGVPEFVQIEDMSLLLRGAGETYRALGSSEGRQYAASSHRPEAGPDVEGDVEELPQQTFNEHLLLPASTDRRIFQLAHEKGTGASPLERARSIEKYLRTSFGYTTELPQEHSNDPLADFLFVRRKGHCEYFASAMAVMLRGIHIPSRVVTGFQSGVYNPMTGWQVIRASDAHSWVEAWLPGRGWTTFDPTPPDTNAGRGLGAVWSQAMLYLDAAETLWRQWIVDYNLEQQLGLVARVERRTRMLNRAVRFDGLADSGNRLIEAGKRWIGYFVSAVGIAICLFFFVPPAWKLLSHRLHAARISKGQVAASDAAVLYSRMLDVLRRRGVEKPAWLTPGEFARSVPPSPASPIVEQITAAYHDLRYGGRHRSRHPHAATPRRARSQ